MTDILLNGRFLCRAPSGVDRVALELARRIARETDARGRAFEIAVPASAPPDDEIRAALIWHGDGVIHRGHSSGYLWEQLELAWLRPDAMLLNLANMGPVMRRRQALMIHDAQIFDAPSSYSRAYRLAYRLLQPPLARRAAHLFTVSHHSGERLAVHGLDPNRRARVIHNGIDHLDAVTPDAGTLGRHGLAPHGYFLAVGSLAAHKNLAFLISLFASRPAGALPLVIAGGGNARVFAAAGLPAPPSVQMLGRVDDGALKALYQNARAFLFPSLTEGFGLPPLEAMRCGCPVVASTGGAIPETCGDAAVVASPTDVPAWRAAIARLETDDAFCTDLAARGRERAARFRWDDAARQLLLALETEAASAPSRPSAT